MTDLHDFLSAYTNVIFFLSALTIASTSLLLLVILRLAQVLPPPVPSTTATTPQLPQRPPPSSTHPTHLLIVLGSGGHTAEMLNILSSLPTLSTTFTHRTYLISSGDSFSALKAAEFERTHGSEKTYTITTVRRARRVHQSFLTTPFTTLLSLWDCISVLRGSHVDPRQRKQQQQQQYLYPDLILTNGPGTGVCVVVAALILRFFGYSGSLATEGSREDVYTGQGQMRTVFIESWARVKTLSLSGKILRPLVNRFLVQWPQLAEMLGDGVECTGPLMT